MLKNSEKTKINTFVSTTTTKNPFYAYQNFSGTQEHQIFGNCLFGFLSNYMNSVKKTQ